MLVFRVDYPRKRKKYCVGSIVSDKALSCSGSDDVERAPEGGDFLRCDLGRCSLGTYSAHVSYERKEF